MGSVATICPGDPEIVTNPARGVLADLAAHDHVIVSGLASLKIAHVNLLSDADDQAFVEGIWASGEHFG
ncbi:hypothetical protein GCM10007989_38310 [Devosia pacifica]|uniref:Uncharacterized protein n=1 Tax=Devosia pacifica TaxID=1335967 RepID=A0A918SFW8_9HYPH|nr:hypothetical protein GCM10007989_38310 [Devosia pacifica]